MKAMTWFQLRDLQLPEVQQKGKWMARQYVYLARGVKLEPSTLLSQPRLTMRVLVLLVLC